MSGKAYPSVFKMEDAELAAAMVTIDILKRKNPRAFKRISKKRITDIEREFDRRFPR